MTKLDQVAHDYLMDLVKKWEITLNHVEEGTDEYILYELPHIPGDISYQKFIDKIREIADHVVGEAS